MQGRRLGLQRVRAQARRRGRLCLLGRLLPLQRVDMRLLELVRDDLLALAVVVDADQEPVDADADVEHELAPGTA